MTWTIRREANGLVHVNIWGGFKIFDESGRHIATCYRPEIAAQIRALPQLLDALQHAREALAGDGLYAGLHAEIEAVLRRIDLGESGANAAREAVK